MKKKREFYRCVVNSIYVDCRYLSHIILMSDKHEKLHTCHILGKIEERKNILLYRRIVIRVDTHNGNYLIARCKCKLKN